MPKRRREASLDSKWDDVIRIDRPGHSNPEVICRYCSKVWYSKSLDRVEGHMERCSALPSALWERYNRGAQPAKQRLLYSQAQGEPYLLPASEQHALDKLLAEAVYASGIPFSFVSKLYTNSRKLLTSLQVEQPAFLRFLQRLKPSYKPPARRQLAGSLLDDAYANTKSRMDNIVAEASGQLTLISDSWTNQRSESLTNYVVTTRQHEIFLHTEILGAERHTSEVILRGLRDTIEDLGGEAAVVAVCTDNAANMRRCWPELQKRYPGLLTLGCASHIINLLVEDILKLSTLNTTLADAIQVIRYFKGSNVRTGALTQAAAAARETRLSLKLPSKTRWQGKLEAISSLIANKPYIQTVIADRAQCLGHRPSAYDAANWLQLRDKLHTWRFWEQLDELQRFLKPFLEVTIALEATKPRASRIYAYFNYLLRAAIPIGLPKNDILQLIARRWEQVRHPAFTVAYICDPAARDEREVDIPSGSRVLMAEWLEERYPAEGAAAAIYTELLRVWDREGSYSNKVIWESFSNYPDPAGWWQKQDCSDELKALAIYCLSINPTTGAAERNWSAHGYLHSKNRNRLTNERVQKLVYLFQNLRVRDRVDTSTPSYFDDDEVELCSDADSDENEPNIEPNIELNNEIGELVVREALRPDRSPTPPSISS